jgi:hypothetical protein
MKKVNLDGVPGITMQGNKGEEGKRGYTTFYNDHEKYELDENNENIIIDKVLAFCDSDKDGVFDTTLCIPTHGFVPSIHDRFLNNLENISLYEITAVAEISDISNFSNLQFIMETLLAETEDLDEDSITYISNSISDTFIPNIKYLNTKKVYFVLVDILDTWMYNTSSLNILNDIEVAVNSKRLKLSSWKGLYDSSIEYCGGHEYEFHAVNNDSMLFTSLGKNWLFNAFTNDLTNIDESLIPLQPDMTLTGYVYDSFTDSPIIGATVELYNIPASGAQSISTLGEPGGIGPSSFDPNNTTSGLCCVGSGITDGDGKYTIEIHGNSAMILRAYKTAPEEVIEESDEPIKNYITSYYILSPDKLVHRNGEDFIQKGVLKYLHREDVSDELKINPMLNVYLVENKYDASDDTDTFTKISVKDDYQYFNSLSPKTTISVEDEDGNIYEEDLESDFVLTQYQVFMPIPEQDRKKLKIVAEFIKPTNKLLHMSTIRTELWKGCKEENDFKSLFGLLENYDYKLNFDNEDPGDFTLIIKDFDEGNDKQVYLSKSLFVFPEDSNEEYDIELYAYYKTKTSAQQKLFLGKGSFNDTLE